MSTRTTTLKLVGSEECKSLTAEDLHSSLPTFLITGEAKRRELTGHDVTADQ
ncbi:hypothetical protein IQ270_24285 [Microcoleus sp. LEGE 07076]|uniref:hypothetical protein n=1 Tax=Microcoleus sp. LEGE 07076 TaxID=915322 RepID=UPI00187F0C53|nr:hypothetical protein [Microcoleus sp. LEGE 07076]MBE9187680.1 hypothetical protein [Microcoleus sp. LEGE 07076]